MLLELTFIIILFAILIFLVFYVMDAKIKFIERRLKRLESISPIHNIGIGNKTVLKNKKHEENSSVNNFTAVRNFLSEGELKNIYDQQNAISLDLRKIKHSIGKNKETGIITKYKNKAKDKIDNFHKDASYTKLNTRFLRLYNKHRKLYKKFKNYKWKSEIKSEWLDYFDMDLYSKIKEAEKTQIIYSEIQNNNGSSIIVSDSNKPAYVTYVISGDIKAPVTATIDLVGNPADSLGYTLCTNNNKNIRLDNCILKKEYIKTMIGDLSIDGTYYSPVYFVTPESENPVT